MDSLLEDLKTSIYDNKKDESIRLVVKISQVLEEFSETDYSLNTAKILNKNYGLIKFVTNSFLIKANYMLIVKILELCQELVKNAEKYCKFYIPGIIEACFTCFKNTGSAKVQEAVIKLFIEIISKKLIRNTDVAVEIYKFLLVRRFNFSQIVEKVFGILIGVLCKFYTEAFNPYFYEIRNLLLQKLTEVINKFWERSIQGYLDGYINFLSVYSSKIETDRVYCANLYNKIKEIFRREIDQQFASTSKTLKSVLILFNENAHLFSTQIFQDDSFWNRNFQNCVQKNKNITIEPFCKFYKYVATELKRNSENPRNREKFLYYYNHFRQILRKTNSTSGELRLAICGLGYFSGPCTVYLSSKDVMDLFRLIAQKVEYYYFIEIEKTNNVDNLEFLPECIQALSEIIVYLHNVTDDELVTIQKINILMIKVFPNLQYYCQKNATDSFIKSLKILTDYGTESLNKFLSDIIYQGVIWTCAHNTKIESELHDENDVELITYKKFLPFWLKLVESDLFEDFIWHEIIQTLFIIIEKLDLSIQNIDQIDSFNLDDAILNNQNDLNIFINVVDFYCDIFEKIDCKFFKKYVNVFFEKVIFLSIKNPYMSGFYKLISAGLLIINKFDEKINFTNLTLLNNFFNQILNTFQQYSNDDLRISMIRMILSCPIYLLSKNFLPLIPSVFKCALEIGQTHLFLALEVVTALQKWYRELPYEDTVLIFSTVLPKLNNFLKIESEYMELDSSASATTELKNKKVSIKLNPELVQLRQEILTLLSVLDDDLKVFLLKDDAESVIAPNLLKYDVFFKDIKSCVYLDQLLPRIIELCLKSSNRKLRINACETLHALSVYVIGKNLQQLQSDKFTEIMQLLFRTLLELSCDLDPVIEQLFKPLTIQLIHCITSFQNLSNLDKKTFLDTLMNSITHPTNAKLRQISAEYLHEYILWSTRRLGTNELSSIEDIISMIITFSSNLDSNKRFGAALAFNSIHKILKLRKNIINIYWLELLHCFLISLSLKNKNGTNCTSQIIKALDNISNGITDNRQIFNQVLDDTRRKPPSLDGILLVDTVKWLIGQCTSNSLLYSKQCQKLFSKLSLCLGQFDLKGSIIDNIQEIDFPKLNSTENIRKSLQTVEKLRILINYYLWILENQYLSTIQLFYGTQHQIVDAILKFIDMILVSKSETNQTIEQYELIKDQKELDDLKFNTLLDIVKFLNLNLDCGHLIQIWQSDLYIQLVCTSLLKPCQLQINFQIKEDTILPTIKSLVTAIIRDAAVKYKFFQMINKYIESTDIISSIKLSRKSDFINNEDMLFIKGLIVLKEISQPEYIVFPESSKLLTAIYENIIEYQENQLTAIALSPATLKYYKLILKYSMINPNIDQICDCINNHCGIKDLNLKHMHYGIYFLSLFHEILIEKIIMLPVENLINFEIVAFSLNIINEILKYTSGNMDPFLTKVVHRISSKWGSIQRYVNEHVEKKMYFIQTLKSVLSGIENPRELLEDPGLTNIHEWIIQELNSSDNYSGDLTDFCHKIAVIDFIVYLTGPDDFEFFKLRDSLHFLKNYFLKLSNDRREENIIQCTKLYKKITELFEKTKSPALLQLIIDITLSENSWVKENNHCSDVLDNSLNFVMTQMNDEQQQNILIFTYNLYKNDSEKHYEVNLFSCKLLDLARDESIRAFFELNLIELYENLTKTDLVNNEISSLRTKIISLKLFKYFFNIDEKLQIDVIEKLSLNSLADLKKDVTKECLGIIFKEVDAGADQLYKNTYRYFICTCYNTAVAIITNTQRDLDMYTIYFKFNLWSQMFDCTINYHFPQEFDELPIKKKEVIRIRRMVRKNKSESLTIPNTLEYLSTQNIFNSTLQNDILKFDFSTTMLKTPTGLNANLPEHPEISIELDDINKHECMSTICALVSYVTQLENSTMNLPCWIKDGLLPALTSGNTHQNIKIFILKIIHNNSEDFQVYAKWLIGPIMKAIVEGCVGNEINYFMSDLILLITQWNVKELNEDDQRILAELLEYLIPRCYHPRSDIYKYNLELLKSIIELWRPFIIPSQNIINYLSEPKTDAREIEHRIKVSAYFLKNNILLWSNLLERNKFFQTLLEYVGNTELTKIYSPATELVGIFMQILADKNEMSRDILDKVRLRIENMADKNTFYHKMYAIHKTYPLAIDKTMLVQVINYELSQASLKIQENLLEIISVCLPTHYDQDIIRNKNFFNTYLTHTNPELQYKMLIVVKSIVNQIDKELLNNLMNIIIKEFINHPILIYRKIAYEIMIDIYRRFNNTIRTNDLIGNEIVNKSKTVLINALNDHDEATRDEILNFWNSTIQDPYIFNLMERLFDLYSVETEKEFLGIYAWLLLNSFKNDPIYHRKIFETLSLKCQYVDYEISLKWHSKNVSLTPLFIESTFANKLNRQTQNLGTFGVTYSNQNVSNVVTQSTEKVYKRFLKNPRDWNSYVNSKKAASNEKQLPRRESGINVYRKYRNGDLPDIEITHEDLIKPLKILAKQDSVIARMLLTSIFKNLVENSSEKLAQFLQNCKNYFKNILSGTKFYSSNLVGTLFEITLSYKNEIDLPPDLILLASCQSGLLSLGSLILEEKIISSFENDEPRSKRSVDFTTEEIDCWLKLANLYKNMSEIDYVHGILGEKINYPELNRALKFEFNNRWDEANKIYSDITNATSYPAVLKHFCLESHLTCLANLSEWEKLGTSLNSIVDDPEKVWTDEWMREKIFPWLFQVKFYNLCQLGQNDGQFSGHLQQWLQISHKQTYLERNFSEYLALFAIADNKYENADNYLRQFENNFLSDWADINNRYTSLQEEKLKKLDIFAEIKTFLKTHKNLNAANYKSQIENLANNWMNVSHWKIRSLSVWEKKLWYRNFFAKRFEIIIINHNWDIGNISTLLKNSIAHLIAEISYYALNNNNLNTGRKYKNFLKESLSSLSRKISFSYHLIRSKSYEIHQSENPVELRNVLRNSWDILSKFNIFDNNQFTAYPDVQLQYWRQKYSLLNRIGKFVKTQPQYITTFEEHLGGNLDSLIFTSLIEIEKLSFNEWNRSKNQQNANNLIGTYLMIANYCRSVENSGTELVLALIRSIFRAMQLGSNQAIQLFPCLILNDEYSEEQQKCFRDESLITPTWMFLDWIPQLLTAIYSQNSNLFQPLVLRIAAEYPNAIFYSYNLSKETSTTDSSVSEFFAKLDKLLSDDEDLMTFLKALLNVNVPENVLVYHIKKILHIIKTSDNRDELNSAYGNLKNDLFPQIQKMNNFSLFGLLFQEVEKYHRKLDNLLTNGVAKDTIIDTLQNIYRELEEILQSSNFDRGLSNYSPWLANFQKIKLKKPIEIPGQYNSDRKPLPEYHKTIVSFKEHITVLPSLRKPIKVTIVGNDANDYPFLIKFGEDLRQDQRIQQLFAVLNKLLEKDQNYITKKLVMKTYKVIPLTNRNGMIEWLENTQSLLDFGFTSEVMRNKLNEARILHNDWIESASNEPKFEHEYYMLASINHNKTSTVTKYNELVNIFPWDTLRKSLINLGNSMENFFFLRHKFSTSYAVLCIAHWILGIGDRNLSNTLISLKTGEAIGIDFGYAFGIATEILRIPELVPFRLTPQIVNIMKPFNEVGILKQSMLRTLKIARSNKDILLSLMNVFMTEPTIDWLEIATSRYNESDSANLQWFPRKKVNLVKKKLDGVNPVLITIEELNQNSFIDAKEGYVRVIKGEEGIDFRAGVNDEEGLSVEDQLECLLNQAMDPNILGRMYSGWDPFF